MFIYDMAGSQYTNFELDLSKKILNLLKVAAAGMQGWDGAEWDEMGWDGGMQEVGCHPQPQPRGEVQALGGDQLSPRAGFLAQLLAVLS